ANTPDPDFPLLGLFTFDPLRVRRCVAHKKVHVPLPFETIMQRHEREIMRYLLRVLSDPEDAADLFQETWLRAYRAYPRLESESDVKPVAVCDREQPMPQSGA